MLICFESELVVDWARVAKTIRDIGKHNDAGSEFWTCIEFIVTHRTPLFVLLHPFIIVKMQTYFKLFIFGAIICVLQLSQPPMSDHERHLQFLIREKLKGYNLPIAKCTGSLLMDLAHEMKELKEELEDRRYDEQRDSKRPTIITDTQQPIIAEPVSHPRTHRPSLIDLLTGDHSANKDHSSADTVVPGQNAQHHRAYNQAGTSQQVLKPSPPATTYSRSLDLHLMRAHPSDTLVAAGHFCPPSDMQSSIQIQSVSSVSFGSTRGDASECGAADTQSSTTASSNMGRMTTVCWLCLPIVGYCVLRSLSHERGVGSSEPVSGSPVAVCRLCLPILANAPVVLSQTTEDGEIEVANHGPDSLRSAAQNYKAEIDNANGIPEHRMSKAENNRSQQSSASDERKVTCQKTDAFLPPHQKASKLRFVSSVELRHSSDIVAFHGVFRASLLLSVVEDLVNFAGTAS
ncbi:unnamed protein product [Timema podura]|uniref:Protein UNC80 C-terminal domain-containing protein n=1 Tax=Timema podura TaxID=61482 RepID=A0ABN7NJ63_TIMPD|nr:unnamed protein product [Timema podura]